MKLKLIFAAAVFQILAVIAMLAYAYAPIYFGKDILIRTTVYDPRDMFRGDYVRLSYGFAGIYELDKRGLSKRRQLHGTEIYAVLKQDKDGKYKFDKYSFERPNGGTFLAGRVDYNTAKFGIEAFFMPPKKARQMERDMMEFNATAVISVMDNGKARIKDIVIEKPNAGESGGR
ncbi:GDYXXLXY domain-containing protein [Campylobacter rectus]|uniref:GDYXXLXY domain-containing protein n=1 Tax=Campylobacter rectus TaxID=203 RepID=UPI0028E98E7C|nr:GDYXXLXY domain-containing protein [Campylobacter rectus]